MKVSQLVERLLQFEQTAELKLTIGPGMFCDLGSIYDNTVDYALYWPGDEKLLPAGETATVVCIELDVI